MDRYIDIIMFLCLFGSLQPPLCQSQDTKELPPCQPPPRTIQFLSFFPCTNSSSVTLPEECDIFAYAAAQLAVERINSNTSILSNTTLELLPIATKLVSKSIKRWPCDCHVTCELNCYVAVKIES